MKETHTIISQLDKLETEMPRWGKCEPTQWLAYQQSENLFFSKLETFLEGIEGLPTHLLREFHSIQEDTFAKDYPELQALKYPRKKEPSGKTEWLTPRAEYLRFFYDNLRQWLDEKPVTTQPRKGRPLGAKYESDHISYGEKSCHIQPNSRMARLCEKMFTEDIVVGQKVHWEDAYLYVYEVHSVADPKESKKLYQRIKDINKRLKDRGIPPLFKKEGREGGCIVRLR